MLGVPKRHPLGEAAPRPVRLKPGALKQGVPNRSAGSFRALADPMGVRGVCRRYCRDRSFQGPFVDDYFPP
ncbi:unannotated protein [freshwater metagenome]|uniref:Unannotated protein n=1 Tax=freshwater metagenome TaxID=449393 RepID=A0A6J7GPK7_9ZZZZ